MGKPFHASAFFKITVVAAVFAGIAVLFWPNFAVLCRLMKKETRLQAEIDRLESENALLRKKIYLLENDPVYIEKIARDELGMSKPEETIYKFEDGEKMGGK